MKLSPGDVNRFLRQPSPEIAAVLLFGPDEGLIRERADTLCRTILGGVLDDPFRLCYLTGDQIRQDHARLLDEVFAISMMGGRRIVRIRDVGDILTKPLEACLVKPNDQCLILIEAGDLAKTSSLRKRAENGAEITAIACYSDGPREISTLIRETLAQHKLQIDDDALSYLTSSLGTDRGITRQELEKLCLYKDGDTRVRLDDALVTIGDTSALALDDVVYHAYDAHVGGVDSGLDRLFLEGIAPVQVIRAAQRHGQRLHLVSSLIDAGTAPDMAIKSLRPPIFFKYADRFRVQVQNWPSRRITRALALLTSAEFDCKSTGYPDETICRQILCLIGRLPGRPARNR